MSGVQEEQFCHFTRLWNEGLSNKDYLPYPFIGDSQFSTLKALLNMVFISLGQVERDMSASDQSQPKCQSCPALQADLLKSELKLSEMKEECRNLSRQLDKLDSTSIDLFPDEIGNVENSLPATPPRRQRSRSRTPLTPIPLRRNRERSRTPTEDIEISKSEELAQMNSPSLLSGIMKANNCITEVEANPMDVSSKLPQIPQSANNNGWISAKADTSSKNVSTTTSKIANPKLDQGKKVCIPNKLKPAFPVESKSKLKFKKPLKQATLKKCFSNAKKPSPVKKVDLTRLEGFDGGLRNPFSQKSSTTLSTQKNTDESVSFSRNKNVGLKRKSEEPEETDDDFVDPDETIFMQSQNFLSRSSSCQKPRPISAPAFGNSTLEMFGNFDKVPNNDTLSPGFAYKPERAIRKKAERAELPGGDCDMCKKYYAAVRSQLSSGGVQQLKNTCSRHRSKHPVNLDGTPPNFWDVDFPSTSECIDKGLLGLGGGEDEEVE